MTKKTAASDTTEIVNGIEQDNGFPRLGIHHDVPFNAYLKAPGMAKHGLDSLHKAPEKYIFYKENPPPDMPQMILGRAFHTLVLEPEKMDDEYYTEPEDAPKRPTITQINAKKPKPEILEAAEYWKAFDACNINKTFLSTKSDPDLGPWGVSDWDRIHFMRDSVMRHPIASIMLEDSANELSMFWLDEKTNRLCKGRADIWNESHHLMCDLKSAADASYSGFQRAVNEYRYDVQDAWYQDGGRRCKLRVDGFMFIVTEKQPPYLTACYILTPTWRDAGRIKYQHDMELYDRCRKEEIWPGYYQDGWPNREPVRDLEQPGYAKFNKIY